MRALLIALALLLAVSLGAEYSVAAFTPNISIHTVDGSFPGNRAFLDGLDARIDRLQMSTGVYLDAKADIYVVPDRASYRRIARGKGSVVEFSNAFYSSGERRIYVRSADQIWQNYAGVLIHEYTHWYLDEILTGAPLWFHEGMATLQGNEFGLDRYYHYIRERFWGNRMDLFTLAYEYPRQRADWEMYYLSSYFAVNYMQDKDPKAWLDFWKIVAENYRQGNKTRFTKAFGQAYRSNLFTFNRDFAAASNKQAWIYLLAGFGSFLFMLLPFLAIFAMLRQRKKMRSLPDLDQPVEEEAAESSEPGKDQLD
jgi:hypothetical protein